jgi:hypothetical protein
LGFFFEAEIARGDFGAEKVKTQMPVGECDFSSFPAPFATLKSLDVFPTMCVLGSLFAYNQPTKETNTQTHTRTNKQTNEQTNKRTNQQTNKQTNKQPDEQTHKQSNKQTSAQTNPKRRPMLAQNAFPNNLLRRKAALSVNS